MVEFSSPRSHFMSNFFVYPWSGRLKLLKEKENVAWIIYGLHEGNKMDETMSNIRYLCMVDYDSVARITQNSCIHAYTRGKKTQELKEKVNNNDRAYILDHHHSHWKHFKLHALCWSRKCWWSQTTLIGQEKAGEQNSSLRSRPVSNNY